MEIKTIKKVVETEVIVYLASDGTQFQTEEECMEYEDKIIYDKFNQIPYVYFSNENIFEGIFPYCDGYGWYRETFIRNKEDVDTINAVLKSNMYYNDVVLGYDMVGKTILICESDTELFAIDTTYNFEEFKKDIIWNLNNIERLMGNMCKKEKEKLDN